jgi:hypothetical protein
MLVYVLAVSQIDRTWSFQEPQYLESGGYEPVVSMSADNAAFCAIEFGYYQ